VFCTVLDGPDALGLDKEKAPWLRELEVRRVLSLTRWDDVMDLVSLIEQLDPRVYDLVTDLLF